MVFALCRTTETVCAIIDLREGVGHIFLPVVSTLPFPVIVGEFFAVVVLFFLCRAVLFEVSCQFDVQGCKFAACQFGEVKTFFGY